MAYTILFEGLSGSGKTTISQGVHRLLPGSVLLDGDELRKGLNNNLGFTLEDRSENIRRIGEVAKILEGINKVVLIATITPLNKDRAMLREMLGPTFIEVYCKAPLNVCEERDVKGMYKQARNGEIDMFTGVGSLFEEPTNADLVLHTDTLDITSCILEVIRKI